MDWKEAELKKLIKKDEGEHLEFKKAEGNFKFGRVLDYCVALANERGGILVLGVTDSPPRRICGTKALRSPEKVSADITAQIGLRVVVNEISTSDGRVLVLEVPSRPTGVPLESNGRYLMRSGEGLVTMTHDELRRIFDEARQDFSREIAPGVSPDDLSCEAITRLRALWSRKSGNHRINELEDTQLLHDLGLIRSEGVTNAGLVLLGTEEALARRMPTAEVIYEYRSGETDIGVSARSESRIGFMLALDQVWSQIEVRGSVEHVQEGLFIRDIPVFDEEVIREALLNAVTHRDYRMQGPVFVRQYPKRLVVESPGGFPEGVDSSNLLWRQNPRNRL
ncbi:MAG: helix-turn-helix domain-containing protein, partial [Phycisphaerae bacterium]